MLHVDVGAGQIREYNIARNHHIFGGFGPTAQTQAQRPFTLIHHGALGLCFILAVI